MSQANTAMKATGGREASRERRASLVQGKAALPRPKERSRMDDERAISKMAPVMTQPAKAEVPSMPVARQESAPAPSAPSSAAPLTGVQASRARRAALVQGKAGLARINQTQSQTLARVTNVSSADKAPALSGSGRQFAQALRGSRARNGRTDAQPPRPSGRVRKAEPLQYPPKVAESQSYGDKKVTGVLIGRGMNVTGDEPGAGVQVTGSQYIGKESGFTPREGGVKVGAARTVAGLTVTGTQMRSTIMVTGDESNASIRITGQADQELADDLRQRGEGGGSYASMQFQRQHNPHGHTVFGTNLGRSAKSAGSRERTRERAIEQTDGGQPISGTALGRSLRMTGDESGSCHSITGDQYLMPASKQELCDVPGARGRARAGGAMGMQGRVDPVTGEKVVVSETWSRQRVSGVDIEHNSNVTGGEHGACKPITGTPYHGPSQYESVCSSEAVKQAAQLYGASSGRMVTGDTPLNVGHVTGTQRGSAREISGTAYYRDEREEAIKGNVIEHVNNRFSVKSPQRLAQLQADATAVQAPSAESRITGTFARGSGKITGNQEFSFNPRASVERSEDKSRITGEGRMEGRAITGGAWGAHSKVSGTEGYTATERNPSERGGTPEVQGFAGARTFKGKGNHVAPTQHVTGMVGWSAKTAARVTLSGGAQG